MKKVKIIQQYLLFLFILSVFLMTGCGGGGGTGHWLGGAELTSLAVTPATASIPAGPTKQYKAMATYSDGTSIDVTTSSNWTSGTLAVATINGTSGLATGVAAGTSVITATYGGKSGTANLTVTTATLSSIAVTPGAATIAIGGTQAFVAKGTYSDGTIVDITNVATWSSGTPGVATVAATGIATGVAGGTSVITATYGGKSGTANLTVTAAALTSIAVTPATATTTINGTQAFVAKGTYADGNVVDITDTATWSSGTPGVATVASTGIATGVAAGTSVITASSGGKSGTANLTVTAATLNSIAVTPATASIPIDGTQAFVAKGTYSDGSIVDITNISTWTSNNLPVATVVNTGVATGVSAGSATITATSGTKSGSGTLTVTAPKGPAPVDLGTAGDYVLLTKTGITNVHTSAITGNIGSSPITAAAMDNVFCSEITGTIYGVDAAYTGSGVTTCFAGNPPASNKTLVDNAVLDMGTAVGDAKGRTLPDATNLGAGDISGMTLAPGLYKWTTGVLMDNTGVTLSGGANDVWIFQIAGDLTVASNAIVTLTGGAVAKNIFWQVGAAGSPGAGATLNTGSNFSGIILSDKQIILKTGATLTGRALADTQVTLEKNTVTQP